MLLKMAIFKPQPRRPELMKKLIRRGVVKQLPAGYEVDLHFKPALQPVGAAPLPRAGRRPVRGHLRGRASVVTDEIETFTETGIRLRSGEELEADVIVTATGLNMLLFGGVDVVVDGEPVDFSETVAYKGMMICGVPNFAMALGYTNASWTLKCDLIAALRLPAAQPHGASTATRSRRRCDRDPSMPTEPFLDFNAGYVLRAHRPAARSRAAPAPWRLHQNWFRDVQLLRRGPVDDSMEFSSRAPSAPAASAGRVGPGPVAVGWAIGALGGGAIESFGERRAARAWSTMKVPVIVASITSGRADWHAIEAAITRSDNEAARRLWGASRRRARRRSRRCSAEPGDSTTVLEREPDPRGWSPFGRTVWTLEAGATFYRALARGELLDPARTPSASWTPWRTLCPSSAGASAAFRACASRAAGGPARSRAAGYEVIQFGIAGDSVLALAAVAADFEAAQELASKHVPQHQNASQLRAAGD